MSSCGGATLNTAPFYLQGQRPPLAGKIPSSVKGVQQCTHYLKT